MQGKIEERLAKLFRLILYSSITGMIIGKLTHGVAAKIGEGLINGGVYLLVSCPLIGLLLVAFDSYQHNKKKLFFSSIIVTFLIFFSIVLFIAGSTFYP